MPQFLIFISLQRLKSSHFIFRCILAKEIFWYISSNILDKNYPNLQLLLLAMLMEEPVQPDWRNRRQILLTLFTQVIPAQTLTSEVCVCTKKGRSCSLVIFSTQIETLVCVGESCTLLAMQGPCHNRDFTNTRGSIENPPSRVQDWGPDKQER